MAKGKFHTQWQWAGLRGEGGVGVERDVRRNGRERGGVGEVEETQEKCDNKKDAEGSKHAAFLIYFGRLDADYGREGCMEVS